MQVWSSRVRLGQNLPRSGWGTSPAQSRSLVRPLARCWPPRWSLWVSPRPPPPSERKVRTRRPPFSAHCWTTAISLWSHTAKRSRLRTRRRRQRRSPWLGKRTLSIASYARTFCRPTTQRRSPIPPVARRTSLSARSTTRSSAGESSRRGPPRRPRRAPTRPTRTGTRTSGAPSSRWATRTSTCPRASRTRSGRPSSPARRWERARSSA
mmetsp:Transcript_51345/g.164918  ORF Transcript_51345/g.164918 Transcript_51345/m.164918 type:complete len:209 (+) Transcript_51345:382-1008(+)